MTGPDLILEEALRIAELGYKVLPCSQDKKPILKGWPEKATTDAQQIKAWFSNTDYLLAVQTGPETNLFVLDVDPKGIEWLAENQHRMLCERVHQTRRGKHFLYQFPQALRGIKTNTVGKLHIGVDTRGAGGCLIWWPAHGLGATGDLTNLTEPPLWLVKLMSQNAVISSEYTGTTHGSIEEGQRNNSLASYCGSIWAKGESKEHMLSLALSFNRERNQPPLDTSEVYSIVDSISGYKRSTKDGEDEGGNQTEDSLALSFVEQQPALRDVAMRRRWMQWNQTVWATDETLETFDRIRQHIRIQVPGKPSFSKAHIVVAVEKLARADRRIAATVDQWDADDQLLNTPDGPVGLQDGLGRDPDPFLYLSKSTLVAPRGKAPRWQKFLEEITDGDIDYQPFLQRMIGYCASGSTHEHVLFFLYGSGANGKGIFLNTIAAIMGDYAKTAPMDTFTNSSNDRHPTDMAMLQGARMVFAQETESGRAWAESRVKSLTGSDPVTARFMRQDFFTYTPKFKLLISGNHLPRLKNVDEAMRRRLHLLPFTQVFKGKDRDPHLAEKLKTEYAGILQWIVKGAVVYQRDGLSTPLVVRKESDGYFESEDLFKRWLDECREQSAVLFEAPMKLFNSFKDFADASNEIVGSYVEFRQSLERAGFTSGNSKAKNGRYGQGLSLKN